MGRRDVRVKSGDLTFWEVSEESVTVPVQGEVQARHYTDHFGSSA